MRPRARTLLLTAVLACSADGLVFTGDNWTLEGTVVPPNTFKTAD